MRLFVSPLSQLARVAETSGARRMIGLASPDADISVTDALQFDERRTLRFNDIAEPREGLVAPSEADVGHILDFAHRWDGAAPLLVSCYAGVSRSTATAFVIACAKKPDSSESELAAELRHLSPSATPNPLIVRFGDNLLGRQGRMVGAIASIGRGQDAFEGNAFAWNLR